MKTSHTNAVELKHLRAAVAIATLAALPAFSPVAAIADPTPSPSPTATPDTSRNPIDQYRIDRENFLSAVRERNHSIAIINGAFNSACNKATQDFKIAMSTAKTPDQKNLAASNRKNAISLAIVARDNAIAALGPEPVPPVEPIKVAKSQKGKGR